MAFGGPPSSAAAAPSRSCEPSAFVFCVVAHYFWILWHKRRPQHRAPLSRPTLIDKLDAVGRTDAVARTARRGRRLPRAIRTSFVDPFWPKLDATLSSGFIRSGVMRRSAIKRLRHAHHGHRRPHRQRPENLILSRYGAQSQSTLVILRERTNA